MILNFLLRNFMRSPIKWTGIVIIVFWLSGCGKDTSENRDHLVFRYNEYGNIPTLDPAFARNLQTISIGNQLFNGLVQLDDSLNILPDIAKSWTINDTTNTYTFILRDDGVRFDVSNSRNFF